MEDLRRAFARLERGALREAKAAVKDAAWEMEGEALGRADWADQSGRTRASIKTLFHDRGLTATIGSGYFKARFHEFGTINMVERPFLNPAFEVVRPKYLAAIAVALNKAGAQAGVA